MQRPPVRVRPSQWRTSAHPLHSSPRERTPRRLQKVRLGTRVDWRCRSPLKDLLEDVEDVRLGIAKRRDVRCVGPGDPAKRIAPRSGLEGTRSAQRCAGRGIAADPPGPLAGAVVPLNTAPDRRRAGPRGGAAAIHFKDCIALVWRAAAAPGLLACVCSSPSLFETHGAAALGAGRGGRGRGHGAPDSEAFEPPTGWLLRGGRADGLPRLVSAKRTGEAGAPGQ